ncbi:MAG TPA: ATP-binding protein [Anaeromyxobacteraceae bacterium]|nr:ATP-binding protein [Anaeromyxobacteraceae bacterium]
MRADLDDRAGVKVNAGPFSLSGLGREIFDAYPGPTLVVDGDVTVLDANRSALALLGLRGDAGPALFRRGGEALHCLNAEGPGGCGCQPACQDCVIRGAVVQAIDHRRVQRSACVLELRKDGVAVERNFLVSASPIDHEGGTHVLLALEDVTDVVQLAREASAAERAAHGTEARLAAVVENLAEGVLAFKPAGEIVHWNRAALDLHGWQTLDEAPWTVQGLAGHVQAFSAAGEPLSPRDWPIERILRGERLQDEEVHVRLPGATRAAIWLHSGTLVRDDDGAALLGVLTIRDVTEKRALRAQLAVGSRLASLGTLVAGVAHEINNPLAAASASIGAARRDIQHLPEAAEALESLADAEEATRRIADIVRDLFLFARPDAARRPVELMDAVNGAMRWLAASVGRSAVVKVENRGAPPVLASVGQIEQVLVNLVMNGAHAAPPGGQSNVTVRVGPGSPGMARIEVADDGVGMTPEVVARVFDPFFTTREAGKGMGLGLPICHAIVVAHGGSIGVESAVGSGTTVWLELPAVPAERDD